MVKRRRKQVIGRRKFRRVEVAWVARLLGVRRNQALHLMDSVYRGVDSARVKTWVIKSITKGDNVGVQLGLEMVKDDVRKNIGGGLTLGRAYYREA